MPRYLSLDWSHHQLLLTAGSTSREGLRVEQALTLQEEGGFTLEGAETLGRRLREQMTQSGMALAPAYACVGRDRVILKEVRIPVVAAHEEPALIRFQVMKELTSPIDEVVIDYLPLVGTGDGTGRRALVVIVKKDVIANYRRLCQEAGLKLAGLTLRPWATVVCCRQMADPPPEPADAPIAVLTTTGRWGEFTVARGQELVFTRPVAAVGDRGHTLLAEIRRNFTVFASQSPSTPIRALYLAGGVEMAAVRSQLQEALGIPVQTFDPLAHCASATPPEAGHGGFAGVVGLLHGLAATPTLPINLIEPKEPRPPRDPSKRQFALLAAAAAALLFLVLGWTFVEMARRGRELTALNLDKIELDGQLAALEEDAKRIKSVNDWLDNEVVWLDELYDLADRIPELDTVRVTQITGQPLPRSAKEKNAARVTIKGIATTDTRSVDTLIARLVQDQFYRVDPKVMSRNVSVERQRFPQQFTTQFDVMKRPPGRYVRRLPEPPSERSRDRMSEEDVDLGFDGFGFGGSP